MPLHTCAPPREAEHKTMSLWVCPVRFDLGGGPVERVFDFDRNEAVTRAEWILVEGPTQLAG